MKIGVHRVAMGAPNDVAELDALITAKIVDPADIVALIGKTEGNGGANDFTRGYATLSYQLLLARHLGITPDAVAARVAFVWSGGTEGVLSPHATIFTRSQAVGDGNAKRLALGIAVTRNILPEEVGTMTQVREVAAAVRACLVQAGITERRDVHYVQVKGPLLTPASIADADQRGATLVTSDPNGSKPYARGATALGVAVGLDELAEADLWNDAVSAPARSVFHRRLDVRRGRAAPLRGAAVRQRARCG